MKKCGTDCIPCCNFCIHAEHEVFEIGTGGPIGCFLHLDAEHQKIAEGCGHCEDFYCFRATE